MKNIITATIEFYFKGKKFTPSITIELDNYLHTNSCLPDFYAIIAAENNIDLYSYEYEMMLVEKISFSNASGLVVEHITENTLDEITFLSDWKDNIIAMQLKRIAKETMGIKNLEEHPELKNALLEAYLTGQTQ